MKTNTVRVGRKPKPTHLRVIREGEALINPDEPIASKSKPICPKEMTPIAAAQWDFVCGIIEDLGLLSRTDTIAIQLLCEAYADYTLAVKAINKNGGPFYKTVTARGKGIIYRALPAVTLKDEADRRIRAWLTEFGMTPSSRSKVKVPTGKGDEDPAEKYFGQ